MSQPEFQNFWRCAHHPSAIDNFFGGFLSCERGCHNTPIFWHHAGVHPLPHMRSERHGMGTIADQIFGP